MSRLLRLGICSLLFCITDALASGELQAQRVAPAGVRPLMNGTFVAQLASDSAEVDRAMHAVWGAAIGAVIGVAVGYHRGKVADSHCGSECAGPAGLAGPLEAFFFGMVGSAVGAVIGYVI